MATQVYLKILCINKCTSYCITMYVHGCLSCRLSMGVNSVLSAALGGACAVVVNGSSLIQVDDIVLVMACFAAAD